MYSYTLKGVCSTKEGALELKKELDELVITDENLYNIVPQDILDNWPNKCVDEDTWEPQDEYMGYTSEQYHKQDERYWIYVQENHPAVIEEFDLI